MNKKIEKSIRERLNPGICHWGYHSLVPLLVNLKEFSKLSNKEAVKNILDLGCGSKPYESLFPFAEKFIGFDVEKNERVDFVGFNWELPFQDDEFDALISTQVLEHTAKIPETVAEIRRVVKNGGLIFISVPLTFYEHGIPYDFYRFTRFGLMEIFKEFEIIKIVPHNGYLNTLLRMWNGFLNFLPGAKYFLFPVFFVNNILGIFFDKFFFLVFGKSKIPVFKEFYEKLYMGFTESYSMVLRNKK